MKDIDFLEHGGGHFHLRLDGDLIELPDPRAKHYQWVLLALYVRHVPGTPGNIPEWQRALAFEHWRAAWDLPEFRNAQRLAYLLDRYRSAAANDLQTIAGVDLGDLWRARRWVKLLDLLDHLPSHSHFSATISMDEEHAEMMAKAMLEQQSSAPDKDKAEGPKLIHWTPEVKALNDVLDSVNRVQHAIIAVNAEKGKAPKEPKPAPRPESLLADAIERVKLRQRRERHEALVARVLPKKKQSSK